MTARTCFTWYGFDSEPRGCRLRISATPDFVKDVMTALHAFNKTKLDQKRSNVIETDISVGSTIEDLPENLLLAHHHIMTLTFAADCGISACFSV